MGFLDKTGFSHMWNRLRSCMMTIPGGGAITLSESLGLGEGPYTVLCDADEENLIAGISNPNLLDNWYFVNPINQRGQTKYTGVAYSIDRWVCNNTLEVSDGYITTTGTINQRVSVEVTRSLLGKEVNLSVLYRDGTLESGTITMPDDIPSDDTTLFVSDSSLRIYLYKNGITQLFRLIGNHEIIAVKTELGTEQTLAHQDSNGNWVLNDPPPNRALELAKCQRYFRKENTVCIGQALSSSTAYVRVPTPTDMRIPIPTAIPIYCGVFMPEGWGASNPENFELMKAAEMQTTFTVSGLEAQTAGTNGSGLMSLYWDANL